MQEMRLRQARRHRETLRAVQSQSASILERPLKSRRRSRWRPLGGVCWRKDEEEINPKLGTQCVPNYTILILFPVNTLNMRFFFCFGHI